MTEVNPAGVPSATASAGWRLWQRASLNLRLMLAVTLVVFCGAGARSFYLVHDEKTEALTRYQEEMSELRLFLTPVLLDHGLMGDIDFLERLLTQHVDAQVNVDLIRWQHLSTSVTRQDSKLLELTAPRWFANLVAMPVIEDTQPLVKGDHALGSLTLRVTPIPVLNRMWRRTLQQVPVMGGLALFMLLWLALILRTSLASLVHMTQAAKRFQQGDLEVRVPRGSTPEFQALGLAFNAMADEVGRLLRSLQASEAKSRSLFENAHDPVMLIQGQDFIDCNVATLEQLGYASKEEFLKRNLLEISPAKQADGQDSLESIMALNAAALKNGYARFDWLHLKQDGTPIPVEVTLTPIRIKGDVIYHIVWRDISERLAQQRAVAAVQSQLQATLDAVPDLLFEVSLNGFIHSCHSRRGELLAAPPEEFLGRSMFDFLPPDAAQVCQQAMAEAQTTGLSEGHQYALELPQGRVWFELSVARKGMESGQEARFIMLARDITERQQRLEAMSWQAGHDALTGLPNRVLLTDRFARATSSTLRQECLLAVCMLDLDGFKPVNDTYGHAAGDELLLEVARRLSRCVRGEDTVARLGGDEFVLLLGDLKDLAEAEMMLQRIQTEITAPYAIALESVRISASVGVTIYPLDDADPDTLLRHADLAMFDAKQAGRNRYQMFSVAQDQQGQNVRQLAQRVSQALENGEFRLFYQPKVNLRTGEVVGMEALIRWQHPERGLLAPIEFLPLVEHSSLMVDIGDWVMHEALRQMALWSASARDWPVSVNIAPRHFQHPDFLIRLRAILEQHGDVQPERLELEIVESAALGDVLHVGQLIADCQRELGVRFALDDFGTGYSSLTYLKRLPVDALKIDQSFVRDILSDSEDLALVQGIIGLATVFKRDLVAEGVESAEHGVLLLRLGCDVAQGYGIARPMPAEQVLAWSETFVPNPSWASA